MCTACVVHAAKALRVAALPLILRTCKQLRAFLVVLQTLASEGGNAQLDLFGAPTASLPEGFRYAPDVVPRAMQDELLGQMPALPFKAFDFHGFEGKRRVCSFDWKYDFDSQRLRQTEAMPAFLLPVRELAARCFGLPAERLQQALATPNTVPARQSAGTRTRRCSVKSSASPCSRLAPSGYDARLAANGSGCR